MSIENLVKAVDNKLKMAPPIGAVINIQLSDGGVIGIDGAEGRTEVQDKAFNNPATTLVCSEETLNGFLEGSKDPNIAYMMGQLKIEGSMGYALKLASLLED